MVDNHYELGLAEITYAPENGTTTPGLEDPFLVDIVRKAVLYREEATALGMLANSPEPLPTSIWKQRLVDEGIVVDSEGAKKAIAGLFRRLNLLEVPITNLNAGKKGMEGAWVLERPVRKPSIYEGLQPLDRSLDDPVTLADIRSMKAALIRLDISLPVSPPELSQRLMVPEPTFATVNTVGYIFLMAEANPVVDLGWVLDGARSGLQSLTIGRLNGRLDEVENSWDKRVNRAVPDLDALSERAVAFFLERQRFYKKFK